jgi:tetratricopeptide (TPR) repeat protein
MRPELPTAERGLVRLYNERNNIFPGQNVLALDLAVRALERDPEDLEQLQIAAWGLFNGLQMRLAVPVLEHALKLDPNNHPMAYYRVMSLRWAGPAHRCIEAGRSYVKAFGEDPDVYGSMGKSAQALGRPEEAVVFLERACQILAPDSYHDCEAELMYAYREVGDRERFERQRALVVDELERRYAASPDNFRIGDNLLSVCLGIGDSSRFERHQRSVHASLERTWNRVRGPGATLRPHGSGMFQSNSLLHAARQGRMREAEQLMNSILPDADMAWWLLDWKPAKGDPAWQALERHPGFIALRDRLAGARAQRFEKYRAVVARMLPTEPDVPGPGSRPSVALVEL